MVNNPGMTGTMVFQAGLAVCMFTPLIAALISKASFKGMGWKPKFKGNIGWLFFAAYGVIPFVIAGAALFFLIFPDLFDTNGSYLMAQAEAAGQDIKTQMEQMGMSYMTYVLTSIPTFLIAPFINISTAIGEEAGWRGFLYPELKKELGTVETWIVGGTIWGTFHFPLMIIYGYEYGKNYLGAPVLGLVVFTVMCIALGAFENMIYEKTESIWFPALLHGSFNAIATVTQAFLNVNSDGKSDRMFIFGPAPNGIISMIPMLIVVAILGYGIIKKERAEATDEDEASEVIEAEADE
jgi:membrane protease YdiL (CAAX protease family)